MKNHVFKLSALFVILIFVLSLLYSVVFTASGRFDSDTAYNLSSYMAEHGVKVNEELIDTTNYYVFTSELQSIAYDKERLSKQILGDNITPLAQTYTSDFGTVAFTENNFVYTPSEEYKKSTASGISKYDAEKKCQRLLKRLGFDIDKSIMELTEENEVYKIKVTKCINSLPVFNSTLSAAISRDGLGEISGIWYTNTGPLKDKRPMKSIVDALIILMQSKASDETIEIINITPGYLLSDTTSEKTNLCPVWQFQKANGEFVYVDA